MIDEQIILTAERLRDDLTEFRRELRARYTNSAKQVTSEEIRKRAAHLAEIWLVEIAAIPELSAAISEDSAADLTVHFQRLLTFSEHATIRTRYEAEIREILSNYSLKIIMPLKQARGRRADDRPQVAANEPLTAFVAHSFAPADKRLNASVMTTLAAIGVTAVTGDKPKADRISEKVKGLIEEQAFFVGIFACRDKIARKQEWTTSPWVIDEKAYAVGLKKRLILLREEGVGSIGGIQGDYEYIVFSREALDELVVQLVKLFQLTNNGLLS